MANTIEAALMIEANIKQTAELVESMTKLSKQLAQKGDDTSGINKNIEDLKAIIETNTATAEYIRKTAVE